MKARPILFSGEMVRAILAGRKTQTRRAVPLARVLLPFPSPYGAQGDLLWVREAFAQMPGGEVAYRATAFGTQGAKFGLKWKPSIFMKRTKSRLTLEIAGVRVERLQAISAQDCIAEGLYSRLRDHDAVVCLREQYRQLWEALNGAGSWEKNPWVWVIEFTPRLQNIDDFLNEKQGEYDGV